MTLALDGFKRCKGIRVLRGNREKKSKEEEVFYFVHVPLAIYKCGSFIHNHTICILSLCESYQLEENLMDRKKSYQ